MWRWYCKWRTPRNCLLKLPCHATRQHTYGSTHEYETHNGQAWRQVGRRSHGGRRPSRRLPYDIVCIRLLYTLLFSSSYTYRHRRFVVVAPATPSLATSVVFPRVTPAIVCYAAISRLFSLFVGLSSIFIALPRHCCCRHYHTWQRQPYFIIIVYH